MTTELALLICLVAEFVVSLVAIAWMSNLWGQSDRDREKLTRDFYGWVALWQSRFRRLAREMDRQWVERNPGVPPPDWDAFVKNQEAVEAIEELRKQEDQPQ